MKLPVTLGAAVLFALAAVTQLQAQAPPFSYRGLYEGTLLDNTSAYFYVRENGDVRFAQFDETNNPTTDGTVIFADFQVAADGTFAVMAGTTPVTGTFTSTGVSGNIGVLPFNLSRVVFDTRAESVAGYYAALVIMDYSGGTAGVLDARFVFTPSGKVYGILTKPSFETTAYIPRGILGTYDSDGNVSMTDITYSLAMTGTATVTNGQLDFTFRRPGSTPQSSFRAQRENIDYRLANISTRGKVGTGADVMIAGFIIKNGSKHVMVRAIAPSLGGPPFFVPGVLPNPKMELHSATALIATNDDWQTGNDVAAIQATGLAPGNNLESALLVSLEEGPYTVIVSGVSGGTGVALVEVYEID